MGADVSIEEAQEISRIDVEAAFLLVMPLLDMPSDFNGKCRLAVALRNDGSEAVAGVQVCFEGGKISYCSSRLEGEVEAWVSDAGRLAEAVEWL